MRGSFDPVACGEEGIEALDQSWMAVEEVGNALDDTRGVDSVYAQRLKRGQTIAVAWRTYNWLLKSFMISRNLLYTSGRSENCILTWSK